jgi:hypothetical protein
VTRKGLEKAQGLTYRQGQVPISALKWGRFKHALPYGLNKTEIYRLIDEGLIESFVYKFRPDAKSGVRLINLESLSAYLDKRSAEAKAEQEGE